MKPAIFTVVFFWVMMAFQAFGAESTECNQRLEEGNAAIAKAEVGFKNMERVHRQKRLLTLREMALTKNLITQAKKLLAQANQFCKGGKFQEGIEKASAAREKAAEADEFHMKLMMKAGVKMEGMKMGNKKMGDMKN